MKKSSKKKEIAKTNSKPGPKKKEINWGIVGELAKIQCTQAEIASVVGVSVDTLVNRPEFSEIYKNGKECGKSSLRRIQFNLAQNNPAMAIWLGKQYLGQRDDPQAPTQTEPMKVIIEYVGPNQVKGDEIVLRPEEIEEEN